MTPDTPPSALRISFTHGGVAHQLVKHPRVAAAYKRGEITEDQARAKPWLLRARLAGKERYFTLAASDKNALTQARDILSGAVQQPETFSKFVAHLEAKRGLAFASLAQDWIKLGCPYSPSQPRTKEAAATLEASLTLALRWWKDKRPAATRQKAMEEFCVWRCANTRAGFDGRRSVDAELAALSSLCQWAVLDERLDKNPFEKRDRFQDSDAVKHCAERAPENDEQLHKLLSWFFTLAPSEGERAGERGSRAQHRELSRIISGAWLAFTALTGLRPEEPAFLYRQPQLSEPTSTPEKLPFGTVFPTFDGGFKMRVFRTKRSKTNPYALLPAVALDFLSAWTAWLDAQADFNPKDVVFPRPLFPDPANPTKPLPVKDGNLSDRVARACRDLNLPVLIPKGIGRAYYVKVRRAQGKLDAEIGMELGQSGDGELIRNVYGNPDQEFGSKAHDWLPCVKNEKGETVATAPAWELLRAQIPGKLLQVTFG